mgnify:CR=1 FL=1
MLPEKHNLKAIFERLKLFKELEPDFKIDKVFYLIEPIEYDFKDIHIGAYIVSKPFVNSHTGDTIVTIINLERTMQGHRMDISSRTRNQGFTCWRIRVDDFKQQFKTAPFRASCNFLYKGGKVDD